MLKLEGEVTCLKTFSADEVRPGPEAGSYLRLIDFMYHSTLGLRVIKKKKSTLNPNHTAGPEGVS